VLWQLAWAAPLVAVVVTTSYSVLVLGATRWSEARRAGDTTTATVWAALALIAALLVAGAVIAGVGVIVSK
jgi:hypothetical protein